MTSLYETDFYAWTQVQARVLKNCTWSDLDRDNLIEELESLGRKERQELENRLGILIGHLLKWQYQQRQRSNSWVATIREQRRKIERLLQGSPSLKPYLESAVQIGYEDGLDLAVRETNLPYEAFPGVTPYTLEQILDSEFFPNN